MGIVLHLISILSYASLICTSTSNDYKRLLRNYDKYQPPSISNGSENAKIEVKAFLHHLTISMLWKDKRLIPEDWQYLFVPLKLDEIWSAVPSVACRAGSKTLELGSGEEMRNSAVVYADGTVHGRSVLIFRSMKLCRSDLTDWPYDTKICYLRFISPAINGARVQYNPVILQIY
ncbi:uncharacterized protein LOC111054850 [Nilaparvata lugens]|uniref:uncharacterized protein LOC111054850 n=1 Tax=Nilaparvata lugens TaxID=108931 RepID=UPI00193D52C1|nr:uncharacterized protein LOC111054850 [Nilaparvata lugens]